MTLLRCFVDVRSLRLFGLCFLQAALGSLLTSSHLVAADAPLQVGVAQVEITPPLGFPMAGYYHERLATATHDPLWAKAIVFRNGPTSAAWVACDLTGVAIDLSTEVRRKAAEKTGIPYENIVVSATHSHTAPDYTRSLYRHLGPAAELVTETDKKRAEYAGQLIDRTAQAIVDAHKAAAPAELRSGSATQAVPVSYSRRFVMRDGSIQTWVGLKHPQALRCANPIDPEIGLLEVVRAGDQARTGLVSNFALHLDTVGGLEWSADYPHGIEQSVRKSLGASAVSLFGTGCCGDINHADPTGAVRRKGPEIGAALGETIVAKLPELTPVTGTHLQARSRTVPLRLQPVTPAEVQESLALVRKAQAGETVEFLKHVAAYKALVLDQLQNKPPVVKGDDVLSLGLSRQWGGIGETIPTEVNVFTVGSDVAIVFLPGEVFVELGLAIKQASPFRTTLIVELSQSVETVYIPTRAGSVGGGYEPTNSFVERGSGERLVEAALALLRESATAIQTSAAATAAK